MLYLGFIFIHIYISYNIPFHGNSWVRNVEGFSFIKNIFSFPFMRRLNYGYHWITSSRNIRVTYPLKPKTMEQNGGFEPQNMGYTYIYIYMYITYNPWTWRKCGFPVRDVNVVFSHRCSPNPSFADLPRRNRGMDLVFEARMRFLEMCPWHRWNVERWDGHTGGRYITRKRGENRRQVGKRSISRRFRRWSGVDMIAGNM